MKIPSLILIACCFLMGACSKQVPSHPDAGLRLSVDGEELARCGFYSEDLVRASGLDEGFKISISSRKMDYKGNGHRVVVEWEADYGPGSDEYTFSFIVDGTHSGKVVRFSGEPVLLLEKPFQISLENLVP